MNKKTLFLALLGTLILPGLALAQQQGQQQTVSIQSMIFAAEQTALFIASGVVVILWIITGLLFVTAQGAPEKLSTAKKALIASVAGTLLVIVAASAIALVGQAFGIYFQ